MTICVAAQCESAGSDMDDADVFSLLTGGGVRFDKQRFQKEFEAFKPKPAATPVQLCTSVSASKRGKKSGALELRHGGSMLACMEGMHV